MTVKGDGKIRDNVKGFGEINRLSTMKEVCETKRGRNACRPVPSGGDSTCDKAGEVKPYVTIGAKIKGQIENFL